MYGPRGHTESILIGREGGGVQGSPGKTSFDHNGQIKRAANVTYDLTFAPKIYIQKNEDDASMKNSKKWLNRNESGFCRINDKI